MPRSSDGMSRKCPAGAGGTPRIPELPEQAFIEPRYAPQPGGGSQLPERRLIDATELFAAMPEDVLDLLREHAVVRQYERNEVLFHQGDLSHDLFVVQSGRIAIAAPAGDGREGVVAVLECGGLFGELGLFDDAPRSADARALTESSVVALEYEPVRAVLRARPEVLWVILRILSQRLRATDEALA